MRVTTIAAVSTHMYTCVVQNKSIGGFEPSTNFGRPTAAVSTHTCLLQKKSIDGWPTNCCCEHTHMCVLQNKSMKKSFEGFEHSTFLADQVLL